MAVTVYMTAPAITVLSVTGLQENVSVLLDGRDRDVMKVWPLFTICVFSFDILYNCTIVTLHEK